MNWARLSRRSKPNQCGSPRQQGMPHSPAAALHRGFLLLPRLSLEKRSGAAGQTPAVAVLRCRRGASSSLCGFPPGGATPPRLPRARLLPPSAGRARPAALGAAAPRRPLAAGAAPQAAPGPGPGPGQQEVGEGPAGAAERCAPHQQLRAGRVSLGFQKRAS